MDFEIKTLEKFVINKYNKVKMVETNFDFRNNEYKMCIVGYGSVEPLFYIFNPIKQDMHDLKKELSEFLDNSAFGEDKSTTLTINFKECCYTCPYRKTETSETCNILSTGGPVQTITIIRCEHDKVCEIYLRNAKEE